MVLKNSSDNKDILRPSQKKEKYKINGKWKKSNFAVSKLKLSSWFLDAYQKQDNYYFKEHP